MSEIDSLNSMNFAGIQNVASNQIDKNNKTEKSKKTGLSRFSQLLKETQTENDNLYTLELPDEIQKMSVDEAAIFLHDAVDEAGNALTESITEENIEKFKKTVKQFITFVEKNNFEVSTTLKTNRRKRPIPSTPHFNYGGYTVPTTYRKKTSITIINKKLDELTLDLLDRHNANGNFKILAKVNSIKGLIVDLMSS